MCAWEFNERKYVALCFMDELLLLMFLCPVSHNITVFLAAHRISYTDKSVHAVIAETCDAWQSLLNNNHYCCSWSSRQASCWIRQRNSLLSVPS